MIPTKPSDCTPAIPTEACPPIDPVLYTVTLGGGWNAAGAPVPPDFGPFLAITSGLGGGSIDPAPPTPGTFDTQMGLALPLEPIVGVPTINDVPGTFQTTSQQAGADFAGLLIPLYVIPLIIAAGQPLWLRQDYIDADGGQTTAYVFFPDGLQAEPTDLQIYVILDPANGDPTAVEINVVAPAGPDPEAAGPLIDLTSLEVTPVYPEPAQYVPVGPSACGTPIPVAFTPSEDPTEVTGIAGAPVVVSGEVTLGEDPLPVEQAYAPAVVVTGAIDQTAADPMASGIVAAGWVKLVFKGYGPAGTTVRALADNIEYRAPTDPDSNGVYSPITIDAPPGMTMAAATAQVAGPGAGADGVGVSWAAYYPPA